MGLSVRGYEVNGGACLSGAKGYTVNAGAGWLGISIL